MCVLYCPGPLLVIYNRGGKGVVAEEGVVAVLIND